MTAHLLTWNTTDELSWPNYRRDLASFKRRRRLNLLWGCGNTKKIRPGDRLYLLCQGSEQRGIVAAGFATSEPETDRDGDGASSSTRYVGFSVNRLLDINKDSVLPISQLKTGPLADVNWGTRRSGIALSALAARALERRWQAHLASLEIVNEPLPEEIDPSVRFYEGEKKRITVNAYERDPKARLECINYHGATCKVCDFDFQDVYGKHGEGFIHVHHTTPLASVRKGYMVNPHKDLVPVCPNCHAMLHRGDQTLTVAQLQRMLNVK